MFGPLNIVKSLFLLILVLNEGKRRVFLAVQKIGMDNAKIWKVLVNHDPIVVVGDVIVLQEKIEPLFSSPCLKKK